MDKSQFSASVNAYTDVVFRAAYSYCGNRPDAEDAVQNAFIKLYKTKTVFENGEHIRKWLVKVAINECKSLNRSFWRRNVISIDELKNEPQYNDTSKQEVFDEIMTLTKKYRVVVHLYYYEGYSCSEIAKMLGISETNVQTRLMRARKMLKKALKEA